MGAGRAFYQSESGQVGLKFLFVLLAATIGLMVWWYANPSSKFIQPLSLRFDGAQFHYMRDTPHGRVIGAYTHELRSEVGTCNGWGIAPYEDVGVDVVTYAAPTSVKGCIPPLGETFILDTTRMVLIDGWFPMRPSQSVFSCVVGGLDCVKVK